MISFSKGDFLRQTHIKLMGAQEIESFLNFPRSEYTFFFTMHPPRVSTKTGHRQKEVINQVNGKLINGIIFVDHWILEHCDTKLSRMSYCHISCQ